MDQEPASPTPNLIDRYSAATSKKLNNFDPETSSTQLEIAKQNLISGVPIYPPANNDHDDGEPQKPIREVIRKVIEKEQDLT
jgi:hypothetical protein